jgi:hypothetical protein
MRRGKGVLVVKRYPIWVAVGLVLLLLTACQGTDSRDSLNARGALSSIDLEAYAIAMPSGVPSRGQFMDGLKTDGSKVYEVPNIPMPGYMKPFKDPTFGTIITRIGGTFQTKFELAGGVEGAWGKDVRHHYMEVQPWSSDNSLIELQNAGMPTKVYLNGESYEPVYGPCPNYQVFDDRWHPSKDHPHERINVKESTLSWFDVTTCTETKRIHLPFRADYIGGGKGGNPTQDGRYVALLDKQKTNIYLVDMERNTVGPPHEIEPCPMEKCNVSFASLSPTGRYLLVHYGGVDGNRIYDVNMEELTVKLRPLPADSPGCQERKTADGYAMDVANLAFVVNSFDNNEEVIVGERRTWCNTAYGKPLGSVVMVRLKDNKVTSLTDSDNEAEAIQMSGQAYEQPGWVYATFQPAAGKPFDSEIVAIKLDGSGEVERLAHTHSNGRPYRNQPQAVPSRDGTRVLFASAWNDHCARGCGKPDNPKAYIVDIRPKH